VQGNQGDSNASASAGAAVSPDSAGDFDLTDPAVLLSKLRELAIDYAPKLAAAILILLIGWLVTKLIRSFVRKAMLRAKIELTLVSFITNILYAALLVFVVISALGKLGVPTNSFVAIIGAAGLAIGFALQGSLSNFAAGVMIIMFRPFKIGDFIEGGGTQGAVADIQIFHTVLNTPDNRRVIVPNGMLTTSLVTNFTANNERRIDLVFGIAYDDDIEQAKAILTRLVAADPRILETPAARVAVTALADSSVNVLCRPWVKTGDYWTVHADLLERAKTEFDAAGISIPFPQRDVHVHRTDGGGKAAPHDLGAA
jgi:small conductance mechanosensitive channel